MNGSSASATRCCSASSSRPPVQFVAAVLGATATLLPAPFRPSDLPYALAIWWMRNWLGVQIVVALVDDMGAVATD